MSKLTLAVHAARYIAERQARGELTRGSAMRVGYTLASLSESFGARPLTQFGLRSVERWSAQHPEWRPGTRALYLAHVRGFTTWMARRKLVGADLLVEMKMPRRPRPAPRPVPADAVKHLIGGAPDTRSRLILALMYGLGLRCCGIASLRIEDIDIVGKAIHVTEKGGHQRRLPLEPDVEQALNAYLTEHPSSSGPLIRSYTQPWRGVAPQYVGQLVVKWMYSTGVKTRPRDGRDGHSLRHSALTEVAEACGDPFTVAELAGWASISTAAVYVRRASTERVRAALKARTG